MNKHSMKISQGTLNLILTGVFGIITACVLIFDLFTLKASISDGMSMNVFFFLTFLFLCFSRLFLAFQARFLLKGRIRKIGFFKSLSFGVAYLVTAILSLVLPMDIVFFRIASLVYVAVIIANRICVMFERRTKGAIIFNILVLVLAVSMVFLVCDIKEEDAGVLLLTLIAFILVLSLFEVLAFAFSKIQLRGLLKIMRKTFVPEIMFGLVILLISFSFYFAIMESEIGNFGDALWYSFAIITTIGFGDMTAKSVVGRILSVILGIYGVIVVATITSVIVNFYNEVKAKEESKEKKEIEEKKEIDEKPVEENEEPIEENN